MARRATRAERARGGPERSGPKPRPMAGLRRSWAPVAGARVRLARHPEKVQGLVRRTVEPAVAARLPNRLLSRPRDLCSLAETFEPIDRQRLSASSRHPLAGNRLGLGSGERLAASDEVARVLTQIVLDLVVRRLHRTRESLLDVGVNTEIVADPLLEPRAIHAQGRESRLEARWAAQLLLNGDHAFGD